ncbi:hypothetical protein KAFR_0D03790 [Kazachstania africana CBS 2517]|uniref:Large ribosomal subunit protein mL46 n=1 Tax=Kazachstania africana (strain ATCC 22294 / BCRC 22015 / CBS 2517 / CECT 1963 / NBRC 1671 / NRRL Y-8276) TaxID=1071382 RepID=H2AUH7_KAZAF|nr:hypothetical protein KAFR_0D03790 [Kazachstania africana CBS 2517]CCF58027.1 hypothetical protein KAFR_0D03790 [Kazachstania africana CBS 2517]
MNSKIPQEVTIRTSLLLSRIPIVVSKPTKFESSYRAYQYELEKRLMWTFPAYYYFKKGTLSEHKFLSLQKKPIIKNPKAWFPKGVPDIRHNRDRRMKQDVILPQKDNDKDDYLTRPIAKNSIETEDDLRANYSSLERKLRNNLYLLVREKDTGSWKLPSFEVLNSEDGAGLHEIAEKGLRDIGGVNINTWTVSNKPVSAITNSKKQTVEFVIKSHILAGKFNLKNSDKFTDFAWLTKIEAKDKVDNDYYEKIDHLLSG